MRKRNFDEMISYFNRTVADMDIDQKYKMVLLGIIAAIGLEHETSAQPERKKGEWLPDNHIYERYVCSVCRQSHKVATCMGNPMWNYCPSCGAFMGGEQDDKP